MSPRVALIVQARMQSTRLPGKVLKEVLQQPLLGYQFERLRLVRGVQALLLATTTNSADEAIVFFCQKASINVFRGNEEDVLSRYAESAERLNAEVIVRITADCPLIDPAIIDQGIQAFLNIYPSIDYLSNTLERTFPRGMDVEIFSRKALIEANQFAKRPEEREHVTLYFYQHPERFQVRNFSCSIPLPQYRLTVDTPQDFELIKRMIETLYPLKPLFTLNDILMVLKQHPDWADLNRDVVQKKVR